MWVHIVEFFKVCGDHERIGGRGSTFENQASCLKVLVLIPKTASLIVCSLV